MELLLEWERFGHLAQNQKFRKKKTKKKLLVPMWLLKWRNQIPISWFTERQSQHFPEAWRVDGAWTRMGTGCGEEACISSNRDTAEMSQTRTPIGVFQAGVGTQGTEGEMTIGKKKNMGCCWGTGKRRDWLCFNWLPKPRDLLSLLRLLICWRALSALSYCWLLYFGGFGMFS